MARSMKITVPLSGPVRVQAVNTDAGHSKQLVAFNESLSDGNPALVKQELHDHHHAHGHVHSHNGHEHSH